jgi:predicted DNA-binding transcriptional regulator YafY
MPTRSARLVRLKELFQSRRAGYTAKELASMTDVHVRTIQRDLLLLQSEMGMPLLEDDGRYSLMQEERLPSLRLTLQQARALMVATRLFLRYSDDGDPDASGALEQLARILPEPVRAQVLAAASSIDRRSFDPQYARNLAAVTDAWARRRWLRLSYRSAGRNRSKEVVVAPYVLEPSAAGFATYVIGYSRTHSDIRTFKVERIVSADMLPEAFDLPPDFDFEKLLSSAWGIIWGEGVQVRLRFAADVAWRVRETKWHPSQQIDELPDGAVELTMSVASMMELGRWVRGWGDKVEVIAPDSLRQELREEALRIARNYSRTPKVTRKRAPKPPKAIADEQAALPA